MRKRRIFYEDSYHHVMNHFIDGKKPFNDTGLAQFFINLIRRYAIIYKIDIYAYCLMPDHFHIVCKNRKNGLPDFLKAMCSRFVMNYNKIVHRKGPLFYDRYTSTVIQDDNYLMTSLLYLYLNPNRKGIVENPFEYRWSSINQLFQYDVNSFIDNETVEQIFESYDGLIKKLDYWLKRDMMLPLHYFGELEFLGDKFFYQKMLEIVDKRQRVKKIYRKRKRDNNGDKQIKEVLQEFNVEGFDVLKLHYNSWKEKRIRMRLLIKLRDECGLKYSQIVLLEPFRGLKYQSLSDLYNYAKNEILIE